MKKRRTPRGVRHTSFFEREAKDIDGWVESRTAPCGTLRLPSRYIEPSIRRSQRSVYLSQASLSEPEWRGLLKVGAVSIILGGILVLASLPLIPQLIPSLAPSSVESGLTALQTQGSLFGLMWGLYLVSDLFYVVAFPALYISLRQLGRSTLVIALVFNTLFVALDVGIDIPLNLSLVRLSASYSAAQGAAQQAYVGAAALAMDVGGVTSLIATFLQFSAVILASYAMTRTSVFGRTTGLLGIISGVVALLFIPAFIFGSQLAGLFNIGGFAFLVLWSIATGYRLYRA